MDSFTEDADKAPSTKKRILSRINSREEITMQIKNQNRAGEEGGKYGYGCLCSHLNTQKMLRIFCDFSFSVSVDALEPFDVSERP